MATDSRGSDTTGWFISRDVTWMDIINAPVAHDIFSRKLWFTENIASTTATFEFIKTLLRMSLIGVAQLFSSAGVLEF